MKIRDFNMVLSVPPRLWPFRTLTPTVSLVEAVIVLALLIVVWIGLSRYVHVRWFVSPGDAASMVDLIKTVARTGWLVNPTIASANDMWPLFGALADKYCSWHFVPSFRDASDLTWHAYWLTFPIAALTFVPGVTALGVAVSLVALSHVGVLWTAWWYLRRHSVPILVVVVFCAAIFFFKPWSESLVGQIYFDRLFLFPGMALVLLVHTRLTEGRGSLVWIAALTFVCVLISERPALMVGVFLIGYPVLRRGWAIRSSREGLLMIALGVTCLVYFAIYTKLVQESPYLSSWTNLAGMVSSVRSALVPGGLLFPQTMKLLAILAPFVFISLFDWRLGLIAVGSVVPNILVSIGGAEKNVFVTHYHMPYLPFVLAAATVGLARLWGMLVASGVPARAGGRAHGYALTGVFTIAGLALVAYNQFLNPYDLQRTFVFNGTTEPGLVRSVVPGSRNVYLDGPRAMRSFFQDVVSVIPRGSEVSAPEWAWTALVYRGGMTIDFMPFGLGKDPYMILMYEKLADGDIRLQVTSFQVPEEVAKIRTCIQERVDQQYKIIKQAEFGGIVYRIYQLAK